MLTRGLSFFVLVAVSACGGQAFVIDENDASADGAAPPDSGASDGSTTHDSGTQDSGVDCPAMQAALEPLREQAKACCANCNIVQCTAAVQDLCCPFSGNDPQAVSKFSTALTAYKAACPQTICPEIACLQVPSGQCGTNGSCK